MKRCSGTDVDGVALQMVIDVVKKVWGDIARIGHFDGSSLRVAPEATEHVVTFSTLVHHPNGGGVMKFKCTLVRNFPGSGAWRRRQVEVDGCRFLFQFDQLLKGWYIRSNPEIGDPLAIHRTR